MEIRYADPGDVALTEFVLAERLGAETPAVLDGADRAWSRREVVHGIRALAAHLTDVTGLRPGDAVGVAVSGGCEFVIAYHGVLAAGGVVVTMDPHGPLDEWRNDVATCDVHRIVADADVWTGLVGTPSHRIQHAVVIGETAGPGAVPWLEALAQPPSTEVVLGRGGDRGALLAGSSGTSGRPKRVRITHHNLTANLVQIAELHRLRSDDVVLCAAPLRHIYGMQMAMNPALRAVAPLVLTRSPFSLDDLLNRIERYRVTVAYLVPSIIAGLADADIAGHDLSSLRLIGSGGAPLPREAADRCRSRLGVTVVQGFGMTEAGCLCWTPDGSAPPPGSVGRFVPGTDVRLVDPATGAEASAGSAGELWVRGPQVSPGYLPACGRQPELRDDEGWMRTGDLVVRSPDGFVSIVGRIKSLIKYKGYQVSPAELEDVLLTHPAVVDAAVVGHPHPTAGEIPAAYVVLSRPTPLADIQAHVTALVAPHKKIRHIEELDAIPRSSTGKVVTGLLTPGSGRTP